MNQNIQNWIIEQASNVTNWANAEIPLVIQEFLIWNFYSGLINIVGILTPLIIPCVIFLAVGLFIIVKKIIHIKVAPKVYLVEKAAELIKQK